MTQLARADECMSATRNQHPRTWCRVDRGCARAVDIIISIHRWARDVFPLLRALSLLRVTAAEILGWDVVCLLMSAAQVAARARCSTMDVLTYRWPDPVLSLETGSGWESKVTLCMAVSGVMGYPVFSAL